MSVVFVILITINVITLNAFANYEFSNLTNSFNYTIRNIRLEDKDNLRLLYQKVATISGGLARTKEEITQDYIDRILLHGINNGLALGVECDGRLIGSMIKYKLEPQIFSHILTEGSILIDPDFQGKGIGSKMILAFLNEIEKNHPEILRIEIIARESNPAIKLYEKLGFKKEGRFERRIKARNGKLEADVPMVWINPNFKCT